MPKEPRREQAITYRPLAGGIGLGLPNAGLGISLGLGGVQPAARTAHPTIDGGNPREGLDEGSRIGGAETRQEILPVTDAGLGDDFIDFDDDPELPADAIHELPLVHAPASDDDDDDEGNEAEEDGAGVADAWADDVDDDPNGDPRWCPPGTAARLARVRSPLIRLHQEIVDFCRYLEPTAEESSARTAAVERVRGAVLSIWPGARFEVHGSFATGMYLPNSDIDAVILGSGCKSPATCLKALALSLSRKGMARKIQLIANARVPIVKFEERPSGFQFDVSFDVANGPASAEIVRANMRRFPALRPLTTVLKAFLQQRALNEVYTGGVGSYALLCMVMAHLQLHDSKETAYSWAGDGGGEAADEGCLGVLLIDFFELYGRRLNMEEVGVSCRGGGAFFAKKDKTWSDPGRPFLLAIEDPQDPTNDLGRNSYGVRQIKSAFEHAFTLLTAPVASKKEFLLWKIVRMDPKVTRRRQPPKEPGAIAGVSADFPQYVNRPYEEAQDRPDGRERGTKKRKAAKTPQRDTREEESSSSESEDASEDSDEESSSESEGPSAKTEPVRRRCSACHKNLPEYMYGARAWQNAKSNVTRLCTQCAAKRDARRQERRQEGDPRSFKTPAGKKRKKDQPQSSRGGKKKGKGYFSKGRPGSTR